MKVEEGATFAVEKGTLEVGAIPRKPWRSIPSMSTSSAPSSSKELQTDLTLQEFTRPWRALRTVKKAEPHVHVPPEGDPHDPAASDLHAGNLLSHYEPNPAPSTSLFPHELHAPACFRDATAVDGSVAFKVSCKLSFNVGPIEPISCRLGLFDLNLGCRVSEDFVFQVNPPLSTAKEARLIKSAMFYVTPNQYLQNLYLVLQTSKVLQGDAEIATLHYCQPEKYTTEAEQAKLVDRAAECSARLGNVRQSLAWGAVSLSEGVRQVILYRQKNSMSDDQRVVQIPDASKGALKERVVPCVCELDIEKMDDVTIRSAKKRSLEMKVSATATALLYLMDPMFHDPTKELPESLQWCREVQPFCPPQSMALWGPTASGPVAVSFVHVLYLYPLSVDRFQHRNIAVKVQLVDSATAMELPLFFGPMTSLSLVSDVMCHVSYHTKTPAFEDEIKLALPLPLTDRHEVVFTFYQVHCKKMAAGKLPMDMIGRAVLPLVDAKTGVLVADTVHALPVVESELKGMAFQVRSRVLSSVYSQDAAIQAFLQAWHQPDISDDVLVQRMADLKQAPSIGVRFHVLRLCRQLLSYICVQDKPAVRTAAFATCLTVFDKCTVATSAAAAARKGSSTAAASASASNLSETGTLVLQYIDTIFDEDLPPTTTGVIGNNNNASCIRVYQAVIAEWITLLRHPSSDERKLAMTHANALLHLITKSLALQWHAPLPHAMEDVDVLASLLDVLLEASLQSDDGFIARKEMLQAAARFALSLFWIVKSPVAAEWIRTAVPRLAQAKDSAVMIHMTFPFLKILVEAEAFVAINTVGHYGRGDIPDAWLAHLLFTTLLQVVRDQTEDKIKSHAMAILRRLFVVQMRVSQHAERVAMMMLPVLPDLLALITQLDDDNDCDTLKRDALICLAATLSQVPEKNLKGFWKPKTVRGVMPVKRHGNVDDLAWNEALQDHVYLAMTGLRHVIDCFLADGLPWQQVLSPDCIEQGKQLSLLDIEVYMKHRNTRRSQLADEASATATSARNNTAHRSLPRNWGKNYMAQRKHSVDLLKPGNTISGGSSSDDKAVDDMDAQAKLLCTCVARVVVKAVQTLVHEVGRHLAHDADLLKRVVDLWFLLLTKIGHGHFDADVVSTVLTHLTVFLSRFQKPIFHSSTAMLMIDEAWSERLVVLAASSSTAAPLAATFLCDLLATAFDQLGSFVRLHHSIVRVVSKNLQLPLATALDAMDTFPDATTPFRPRLTAFVAFLRHVHTTWQQFDLLVHAMGDMPLILQPEVLQDALVEIVAALAPEELLDVQLMFLDALVQVHVRANQFAEAAQCKLLAVAMARRALVAPPPPEFYVAQLKLAKGYADQAGLPELALDIAESLLRECRRHHNLAEYAVGIKATDSALAALMAQHALSDAPPISRYFVVAVVGLQDEPEYIYKRSAFCHVTDMMDAIERHLSQRFEGYKIKPWGGKPDASENPNTTLYIRATPIEPAFKGETGREFTQASFLPSITLTLC
ncbi:Aste57867_22956 [Aphanomyces stellatus]|uniref:Aste57867_22956 protein n=1 Tax=Aphanomyces stellatus TaxID=120398 RepID=A0A485LLK5_9STRA|nr:hypothetical protein As57867_022885 [Aphanomyces stellatus]VFT99606.1 Aste57867_22956 [Aphanomyces stellatus]